MKTSLWRSVAIKKVNSLVEMNRKQNSGYHYALAKTHALPTHACSSVPSTETRKGNEKARLNELNIFNSILFVCPGEQIEQASAALSENPTELFLSLLIH